jgi:hypothetical protein
MSKKETRIYKSVWKPGAEDAAKKFGFVSPEEIVRKNVPSKSTPLIEQILTGWGNYVKSHFVELSPELKAESQKRLEICDPCSMRDRGTCSTGKQAKHVVTGKMMKGCGCRLAAKALSPGSVCPLGKW